MLLLKYAEIRMELLSHSLFFIVHVEWTAVSYFYLYLNEQFNMKGTLFWQHKTVWFENSQTFAEKKKVGISWTSSLLLCCYIFEIHNILHVIYLGMI